MGTMCEEIWERRVWGAVVVLEEEGEEEDGDEVDEAGMAVASSANQEHHVSHRLSFTARVKENWTPRLPTLAPADSTWGEGGE